jgi:ornithine racemase
MPELRVDVEAIGRNTEVVAALLRERGLALVAVTKGCLGEPRVAAAMLAGGAVALADTRDQNLARMRAALPGAELHRIHLPSLSEPFEWGDVTYVTSREGAAAVAAPVTARSAKRGARRDAALRGKPGGVAAPRRVMIQVETGDEREGVPEDLLMDLAGFIAEEPRLVLEGVATNYACFSGPPAGLQASVEAVAAAVGVLRAAGFAAPRVSGGNSSVLWLLTKGTALPGEITELRCGEALLLGQDALCYRPLPGCVQDACVIRAEVLEEYTKPASRGPATASQGQSQRIVLGIGRQDLGEGTVTFLMPGLTEVGRSADYLVAEVADGASAPPVGAPVEMRPAYEALVAAWTSPYVEVRLRGL